MTLSKPPGVSSWCRYKRIIAEWKGSQGRGLDSFPGTRIARRKDCPGGQYRETRRRHRHPAHRINYLCGWRGWLTSILSRRIVPSLITGGVRPRGRFPLRLSTNPERGVSPSHPCSLKTVPEVSDVGVAILATGYSHPFPPLDPLDPCNQPPRGLPTNGRRDYEHRSSASRKRTTHGEPQLSFLNRQADRASVLVSPRVSLACHPPSRTL